MRGFGGVWLCVLLSASGVIDNNPRTVATYAILAVTGWALLRAHQKLPHGIVVWQHFLTGTLTVIALYSLLTSQGVQFAGFSWIAGSVLTQTIHHYHRCPRPHPHRI